MRNHSASSIKYHLGFSLLEMLVALVVFSSGLLALASFQTTMLSQGSLSKEKAIGDFYAKQKMEQLRRAGFNNLPQVTATANTDTITDQSASYNRTWSIANGPVSNERLVKVVVSWTDRFNMAKSVELVSYISKFDQLDFANLAYTAGASSSPIATIKDWKKEQSWGRDVIVKFKGPNDTVPRYYISPTDGYNFNYDGTSTADALNSSFWTEVMFVEGTLTWTPNSTTTHSVCELRFGDFNSTRPNHDTDEITSFGTKTNGNNVVTYDATAINPNINPLINGAINTSYKPRRCSPNLLSGIGVLTSKYACYLKSGETAKQIYAQCEIEDGNGGTAWAGPMSSPSTGFTAAQTGFNISLAQTTAVPTAVPTPTPTPVGTPVGTPLPTAVATPTPTPLPKAVIAVVVNMSFTSDKTNNYKDSTTCSIPTLVDADCGSVSWSTNPTGNVEVSTRNYGATCTITGPNPSAKISCKNSRQSAVLQGPTALSPGSTTTFTFNNM